MNNQEKGKKYGGRKKGTPNKVTAELRERVRAFLDDNFDEAVEAWKEIDDPKDKMKLYNELISYAVPKMSSVQFTGNAEVTSRIEDKLSELSDNS